ncbi:hypothetical protein Tco_0308436 [Tanacetum coccineum]
MESANPSCSTSNREFLDPKKKKEIESWLGHSRIVDSYDGPNEIEYFDTFPTLEELEYHDEAKASEAKPKAVRKNNDALIIEDWVSDSEEENMSQTKIEKKTYKPSFVKIDFVKAKQTNKTDRKTAKQTADPLFSSNSKSSPDAGFKPSGDDEKKIDVKSVFLYGLQQVPRLLYGNLSTYLLDNGFQRGKIDKTLFRRDKGLQGKARRWEFFSVKTSIVTEILKKIILTDVKTASHTYGKSKAFWRQDEDVEEVEVHLYNQLQVTLKYLTSSET